MTEGNDWLRSLEAAFILSAFALSVVTVTYLVAYLIFA